jgi:hypothetical protein
LYLFATVLAFIVAVFASIVLVIFASWLKIAVTKLGTFFAPLTSGVSEKPSIWETGASRSMSSNNPEFSGSKSERESKKLVDDAIDVAGPSPLAEPRVGVSQALGEITCVCVCNACFIGEAGRLQKDPPQSISPEFSYYMLTGKTF